MLVIVFGRRNESSKVQTVSGRTALLRQNRNHPLKKANQSSWIIKVLLFQLLLLIYSLERPGSQKVGYYCSSDVTIATTFSALLHPVVFQPQHEPTFCTHSSTSAHTNHRLIADKLAAIIQDDKEFYGHAFTPRW